jgi:hypothetical protein
MELRRKAIAAPSEAERQESERLAAIGCTMAGEWYESPVEGPYALFTSPAANLAPKGNHRPLD